MDKIFVNQFPLITENRPITRNPYEIYGILYLIISLDFQCIWHYFNPMPYSQIKKSLVLLLALALTWTLSIQPVHAYAVNKSAVVLLVAKDSARKMLGTGTGFIVKPEGVLVTNYHVLLDAADITAVMSSGDRVKVKSVLKVDREKDFALLQLTEGAYSTLEIGDSDQLKEFDYLSALGFLSQNALQANGQSNGKGMVIQTFGFVLGIHPQAQTDFPFIYTTASFGPGFSGGPVVNQKNRVVGVATVEGRSINLALPINFIKPFLDSKDEMSLADLLKADKNSKEAHYYRGNYYLYVQGDPDKAVKEFESVLKQDDSFVLAHYDLAAAYQSQGQADRAIKEYERANALNPAFPEGSSNLGGYYFRQQKYEQAVKLFKQALKAYPNFIQAHSNLGAVLNKLNRSSEAVPHLEKAIQLDPGFGIAYFNLGNAHVNLDNLDEARKAYDMAVEKGIDFLSLHWNLHKIHSRQGRSVDAKRELEIILQIDPQNPDAQKKFKELSR